MKMRRPSEAQPDDDMLPEYDFSEAEVGKYAERYARARRTVRPDPEVTRASPASEAEATPPKTLAQRPPIREF